MARMEGYAADFLDTHNVGMLKFLQGVAHNSVLVDSAMKRECVALGEKVSEDHVQA